MSLDKIPMYIIMSICLLTMYFLFAIKENVLTLKIELNQVHKQIEHEKDTIHLLKAEFAYLSSPERLRKLNDKYLNLESTQVAQMSGSNILSDHVEDNEKTLQQTIIASSEKKISKRPVKWRYKNGPSKYVTVSY